jgi:hypothetical protein
MTDIQDTNRLYPLRILDLRGRIGHWRTLFGDRADVIKIEPPAAAVPVARIIKMCDPEKSLFWSLIT